MKFICVTVLIITGFTDTRSEQYDVVGPSAPLFTVAGEDVILPCSIKPSISAVDMRVEWFRLDLKDSPVVHLYNDYEDKNTDQLQSYRERTQLFKDELQKGNTSLKLSRLQISDEGVYKCFIQSKSWTDNIIADIRVEAVGSPPLIAIDGFDASGGLQLQCEIKGWNPEPDLVWLDSEGVTLRPQTTDTHRDTDGFRVKHMITVYSDSKYHCRVKMRHHMLETEIITSSKMFTSWRTSVVLISVGVLLSVITGILIALFVYKKREQFQFSQSQKKNIQNVITNLRKYTAVNVTLDPIVAHPRLTVSHDGKQVRDGHKQSGKVENGDEEQNERFSVCLCVLGVEGFTSDFYYEVEVKGKTEWDAGVTRESINKKEKVSLKPTDGRWTVGLRDGIYRACGYPHIKLSLIRKLQRLGVHVNYGEGRVSFYDVEVMCHIYTYSGQHFDEKLHPFFCLGPYWCENSTAPLKICNDF